MGKNNKENVQLVISHFEGCSGNFLAHLAVKQKFDHNNFFRIDVNLDPDVLAIDGINNWETEITRLDNHVAIVTHNYQYELIKSTFPNAKIIQIYPYTHVGNVLYNICFKKLNCKISNLIDNQFIHIVEWHDKIKKAYPGPQCYNFSMLNSPDKIEHILGKSLNDNQMQFFNQYSKKQLQIDLSWPVNSLTINELINFWNIEEFYNEWSAAWTIYVFEQTHGFSEEDRLWSIDNTLLFKNWDTLKTIENFYR